MRIKFKVEVGYKDFVFDDSTKAMDFAITAKKHYCDKDGRECDVTVTIIMEDDKED